MKKIVIVAVIAAILFGVSPLFAQNNGGSERDERDSAYYYVNITLERIFPYRTGYVVQYKSGVNRINTVYIPNEWFTNAAAKGEIINLPRGREWPSMSVYYKEGEFSHVRLYVHPMRSHQTWGTIPQNVNLDSRFENVETIELKF